MFWGDVPDGSFEDSKKLMLKALELQPGIVIATFNLSLTYREMGEKENEIEIFTKVVRFPKMNFRDTLTNRKAK